MRTTLAILFTAVVVGACLGSALGYWRVTRYRELNDEYFGPRPFDFDSRFPALPEAGQALPRAVVDHETFDFGTVEAGATLKHAFAIRNDGTGVLELRTGETTCKCTISGLDSERVEPGETTNVTLEWTVDGSTDRFAQSAAVLTSDPHRRVLRFRVEGQRQRTLVMQPETLAFTKSADETVRLEAKLVSDMAEPFSIAEMMLEDEATAAYFDVESTRLTEEELAGSPATQGFAIRVRVKPGLPVGPVRQTIRLITDRPDLEPAKLPLHGSIESGISIAGRGWDRRAQMLRLGVVNGGEGTSTRLVLTVRGALRESLALSIREVKPELLLVKLGEWSEVGDGRVRQMPLLIEIPAGTPAANRLGGQQGPLAEIVLETNHPEVREVRIPVQFAVEGYSSPRSE